MKFDWKKVIPHLIAIAIFLIVALIYCSPALQGKVLQQHDITQWQAMARDVHSFKEKHGEAPLWTISMFSGMPSYLIATQANNVVPYYFSNLVSLFLLKPVHFFFLACICFYFLTQVLRANTWIGTFTSLGYAYATYNVIIVAVGHDTKMLSIALLPAFLASIILIYERKYLWGAALTAMFTGAMVSHNHYQIVYYSLIIAVFMSFAYIVRWIMQGQVRHALTAIGITIGAGLLGVLMNAVVIFINYEYTKESIRGGSELATGDPKAAVTKTGLNTDYAFSYSMFKSEPFVMLVPGMFGGSSDKLELEEGKSKAIEALQSMPQELAQQLQSYLRFYWGGIGGTSGPPYAGAIICFLAILGFVILDNKHKWWILACCVLTIMMSWGEYFLGFNKFLFDTLPMYNRFRAPSMILVVPTFLLSMLSVMAFQKLFFGAREADFLKRFKTGLYLTAGLFAVLLVLYLSFEYKTPADTDVLKQVATMKDQPQVQEAARSFFSGLQEDRKSMFLSSIIRSLLFIAVAIVAFWLYFKNTIKPVVAVAIIGIFAFIDVMSVDVKYLSSDNYQQPDDYASNFDPQPVDQMILKDTGYFRVLDLRHGGIHGAFNAGALTAYHHKTIGGYHPAKLSIYQDLVEKQLYKFPNCQPVLNMLNTKYIIAPDNNLPYPNGGALGAAWYVKGVQVVKTGAEEMGALDYMNTGDSAVVREAYSKILTPFTFDSSASIQMVSNLNDVITYRTKTASPQFAVFSEVFYDKGWNLYIDNKESSYGRVNYVLRGAMIPAGEHVVEFRFEPKSHAIGSTITTIASIIGLLLLVWAIAREWMKNRRVSNKL